MPGLSPFSFAVGPSSGTAPTQEVTDFDQVSVKFHLIDGDTISFSVSGRGQAAKYIDGLASDVWLYNMTTMVTRADHLWQRFRILPAEQQWGENGENDVAVNAVCYKHPLNARFIHPTPAANAGSGGWSFTNTEQGIIIGTLIQHTQLQTNGDLGIVFEFAADYTTGINRDRTEYKVGDNIGNLIADLTKVQNGPTWAIRPSAATTAQRVLYVKMASTFPTHATPAMWGGNCKALKRSPGNLFANSGFCPGNAELSGAWVDAVGIASDPRGRWEATRSTSTSTVDSATVTATAQGVVDDYGKPPATWTMEIEPERWLTDSRYTPGMFVNVKVPPNIVDPLGDENAVLKLTQVIEVSLTVGGSGETGVSVTAIEVA